MNFLGDNHKLTDFRAFVRERRHPESMRMEDRTVNHYDCCTLARSFVLSHADYTHTGKYDGYALQRTGSASWTSDNQDNDDTEQTLT